MWKVRIINLENNTSFIKHFNEYEYEEFKRKCKYSKKLKIVCELRLC